MQKQKVIHSWLALFFLAGLLFAAPAFAGEPVVWDVNSRAELLKGERTAQRKPLPAAAAL